MKNTPFTPSFLPPEEVRAEYLNLLKTWLDALLSYAVRDEKHPALDGAILCPACSVVHGRCGDAVYPLLCLARRTGDTRYLDAAKKLFRWSQNLLCDDGSIYNDSQSTWNGVTVFSALSLVKALKYHSSLLDPKEKAAWEARLLLHANWLKTGITVHKKSNVNYVAANAAAMALCGEYFSDGEMLSLSKELLHFALEHVSPNDLIFGEGSLLKSATPGGQCAVDMGYNVEETLPSLWDCAVSMKDEDALSCVRALARAHLAFMLPDGAWDNSFGTRNFKWTYWGSRTSDGCQALLNALGKTEGVFAEAAYRNLLLLKKCTSGLLYGGPDYRVHGEEACVHHAFCHAKALAQALDEGVNGFERQPLPSDAPYSCISYPEIGTARFARGPWRMTLCAGDFEYMKGGHASGGALTLLWHKIAGPVCAVACTDYSLKEAHNQQLTRKKRLEGSLCPRIELSADGTLYSQAYDFGAEMEMSEEGETAEATVRGRLCDISHAPMSENVSFLIQYALTPRGLSIRGRLGRPAPGARFVLPVLCPNAQEPKAEKDRITLRDKISVCAKDAAFTRPVFCLAPGFEAAEISVPLTGGEEFEVYIGAV